MEDELIPRLSFQKNISNNLELPIIPKASSKRDTATYFPVDMFMFHERFQRQFCVVKKKPKTHKKTTFFFYFPQAVAPEGRNINTSNFMIEHHSYVGMS